MQPRPDPDSEDWLRALTAAGSGREAAVGRLHEMLVRVATREVHRRAGSLGVSGPELDDLANQAADDAVIAILRKLDQFRGESRFTTWAYRFAILEVSSKVGRHVWRTRTVRYDAEDWDRLPAGFGLEPEQQAESHELMAEIRRVVDAEFTPKQRRIFVAIVLNGVPLDALVIELDSSRNAIYKTLFDARRKLRAVLEANGYLESGQIRTADGEEVRRI